MRIGCLDTETSGLDVLNDRVVDFYIRDIEEPEGRHWRVNPGVPMPEIAAKTHGITDEMLKDVPVLDAQTALEWVSAIQGFDVIVGYNVDFDIDILRAEFARVGVICCWPSTVVCVLRMWSHFEPRGLMDAFKRFVSPEGFEGAHGAAADVDATIQVFHKMREFFGALDTPLEDLNPQRKLWCGPTNHFRWDSEERLTLLVGFGKHKGKPLHEMDVGFLRWMLRNDFPDHVKRIVTYTMAMVNQKQVDLPHIRNVLAEWARERDK